MYSWYQRQSNIWRSEWAKEEEKKKQRDRTLVICGCVMLIIGLVGCTAATTVYLMGRIPSVPQEELPKANYDRPNIIFITAEEIGWNDIHYENPRVQVYTPNLDNMARYGRTLENHYVQPDSVSSHHAFLTGRLPYKSQMQHGPFDPRAPYCTGSDLTLISRSLKQFGYSTHAFGRWHLGFCNDRCTPLNRGFDHFYGHYTDSPNGTFYDWKADGQTSSDLNESGRFYTELLADRVIETLSTTEDPLFIYLAFGDVHKHFQIPSGYTSHYPDCDAGVNSVTCLYMGNNERERQSNMERRNYLGFISAIDEAVGRIQRAVRGNTVIIFTPDTGGSHLGYADNLPLKGATSTLYEGGTRTRAIISSPLLDVTPETSKHKGLFHATDWAATITSLAGASLSYQYDGLDQTGMVLFGSPSNRDEIIYNLDMEDNPLHGQSAIRNDRWKLIWGFDGVTNGRGMIQSAKYYTDVASFTIPPSPWQLESLPQEEKDEVNQLLTSTVWNKEDLYSGTARLYDLQEDPYEYNDLSADVQHASVIQQLKAKLVSELLHNYVKPPTSYSQPITSLTDPTEPGWC